MYIFYGKDSETKTKKNAATTPDFERDFQSTRYIRA